jgi:gliding motility-associated-like protein
MKNLLLSIYLLFSGSFLVAQEYTVNGNATRDNCHCYTLTPNLLTQSGSVWNKIKIDLSQSFDFVFDINLGCSDAGADGIVFVLQPISTSVGTTGGGLGFEGVAPSVGVTIDTWQNTDVNSNDPAYDHIAIQLNGNINHQNTSANIAGPVTAVAGNDNIEDCKWHTLRIQWNTTTKEMNVYVDGIIRLNTIKDFVADVFGGNPLVFWGFTGSTGGERNLQQFCTALTPAYKQLFNQKRCVNQPITFSDSIIAFAPVAKVFWDFGDGSPIDSVSKSPAHTYTIAGNYTVRQTVIGADGCIETNTQVIKIGSIPIANFSTTNGCTNTSLQLNDSSTTAVGTINEWTWILGNGDTSYLKNPTVNYTTAGIKAPRLTVKSIEGCESAPLSNPLEVYPLPASNFNVTGKFCKKINLQFTNLSTVASGSVAGLKYDFGNGQQSLVPNPVMQFDSSRNYNVMLTALSDKGCSKTVLKSVFIMPSPTALFNYTIACLPAGVNFKDSSFDTGGGNIINWWWLLGNGTTAIVQNPSTSYTVSGSIQAQLLVSSINGCFSDTLKKTIFIPAKPVAKFSYGSILCKDKPLLFSDSSTISNGIVKTWNWYIDGILQSNQQNPSFTFSAGNHAVQLLVKNEAGCSSDTTIEPLLIQPLPVANMQFTDGCKNEPVLFTGNDIGGGNITNWQWNFGDATTDSTKDTQHIYSNIGNFKIQLNLKSNAGCTNFIDSFINIYGTNAFAGNDTIIALNQPVQLQATGGLFYQWSPAFGLSNSTIANPIAIISQSIRYTVTASSLSGCKTTDSVLLKAFEGPDIYVPKAFTPNGDGLNDQLKSLPVGMRKFNFFTIYNRNGEIVFSSGNATIGWNGVYKGVLQSTGVYVWIASAINYKGVQVVRKGTVMLIR